MKIKISRRLWLPAPFNIGQTHSTAAAILLLLILLLISCIFSLFIRFTGFFFLLLLVARSMGFYSATQICIARSCYGNVVGWLAGWLSVSRRYCIKTAKPILRLFRPSGSPIILVSSDHCTDTKFQGEPLQRGVKYTGGGKNRRLSTEISVYLGNGAR